MSYMKNNVTFSDRKQIKIHYKINTHQNTFFLLHILYIAYILFAIASFIIRIIYHEIAYSKLIVLKYILESVFCFFLRLFGNMYSYLMTKGLFVVLTCV